MAALINIGINIRLWVSEAGAVRFLVSSKKNKKEFVQMVRGINSNQAATDNDYRVAPPEVKAVKLMNIVVNQSVARFTHYVAMNRNAQVVITPGGYIDQLTLPLNNANEIIFLVWQKLRRFLLVGDSCC
jgi:hypothetical protein